MSEPTSAAPIYRLAWVFYLVLAVAGALWLGWQDGMISWQRFVSPASWWLDLGAGLAAGALLLGLWELGRRSLESARRLERRIADLLRGLDRREAVALALISAFAEEIFFRGAMQQAWGWIVATAVFTLLHTGPGRAYRMWTLFAAAAGLTMAGLAIWRSNLLAPITAHALVNGVNLRRLAGASGDGPGAEGSR